MTWPRPSLSGLDTRGIGVLEITGVTLEPGDMETTGVTRELGDMETTVVTRELEALATTGEIT